MGGFEIIVKWKIMTSLKVVMKGKNMGKVWKGQELKSYYAAIKLC